MKDIKLDHLDHPNLGTKKNTYFYHPVGSVGCCSLTGKFSMGGNRGIREWLSNSPSVDHNLGHRDS
jgi:hypothetical protein